MLNVHEINKKIKQYELFLDDTLKVDLKEVQKKLNDKAEKYKEWEEVKQVVKTLQEFEKKDCDMTIRLPVGCGVHTTGEISDFRRTYISVGLGIMLEMDCLEAERYADIRLRSLQKDINHHRQLAVNIKVNIKMVLLAIGELQLLS